MTAIDILAKLVAPRLFTVLSDNLIENATRVLNGAWPVSNPDGALRPVAGQVLVATPTRAVTTIKRAKGIEIWAGTNNELLYDTIIRRLDEPTVIVMFSKTLTPLSSVFATVDPRLVFMTIDREIYRFNGIRLREYHAAGLVPRGVLETEAARRIGLKDMVAKES